MADNRTFRSLCAVVSIAWLGACDSPAENPDLQTEADVPYKLEVGDPVTSLSDIEGFWLVERFGDFWPSPDNSVGWRSAYVQVGRDGLFYSIGCNHSSNPASLGEDGILRDTGDGSRLQTLMGCPEEWDNRDGRFFGFFGSDPKVNRLGKDRLLLKSGASELVLVEPEAWRLANIPEPTFVQTKWVPVMASSFDGWGASGFGIGEDPGIITIAPDKVTWSECPDAPIAIEWTADGRLGNTAGKTISCQAMERTTDNGKSRVMRILSASPAVIRTGPFHLTLVDGDGQKGRKLDLVTLDSVRNPLPAPPLPPSRDTPPPPPEPPPPPPGG